MNEHLVLSMLQIVWQRVQTDAHRCLISSLIIRETFGGDVVVSRSSDGRNHFYNRILGLDYNFSPDHVADGVPELIELPELLERLPFVRNVLGTVRAAWRSALRKRKSLPEISHIIVQDEEDNSGSWTSPDFSCVLITADSRERLNTASFCPGQTFWLKRASGPIVARAELDRWIVGDRTQWTSADLCNVTRGHSIARKRSFWQRLEANNNRAFLLALMTDPEPLEVPLYPFFRSHGQRVIDLPDAASEVGWLYADGCILNLPPAAEEVNYRNGYQFRWESLLSPEVSFALTERMPHNGRFRDRLHIVNSALRDYFNFLASISESDALGSITPDELTMLAELLEDAADDSDPADYLMDALLELGYSCAYSGAVSPNGVELIALRKTLQQLEREHWVILLDDLRKLRAQLEEPCGRRDWLQIPDEE